MQHERQRVLPFFIVRIARIGFDLGTIGHESLGRITLELIE
jgi:hypothetical protein